MGPNGKFSYITGLCKETQGSSFKIGGNIQLTSLQLNKSQFLKGYSCCFGSTKVHDEFYESVLFAYCEKNGTNGKITISEIGTPA